MAEMPLLIPALVWISGIILGRTVALPVLVILAIASISLLLLIFKKFRIYLILALIFLSGTLRFNLSKALPANHLGSILQNHELIVQPISGRIVSGITFEGGKARFLLELREISGQSVQGRINFSCRVDTLKPFDIIETVARINRYSSVSNPGSFDYREFQESRQIYGTGYAVLSVHTSGNQPSFPNSIIVKVQEYLKIQIEKRSPKHSGFIRAVLLGDKRDAGVFRDNLNRAGLSHLLAVSGLHVGVIALIFFTFFRLIIPNRIVARILTILSLVLYAGVCNWSPSVFRASIMISLYLLSKIISRKPQINNTLCASLIIITAINPQQLFSIGLQLSFMAVITLVNIVPLLPAIRFRKEDNKLNKAVKKYANILIRLVETSFTLSLFLLPITAFYFNQINFNGILANIVGIPLFSILILPVAIVMLLSPIPQLTVFYSDLFSGLIAMLEKWVSFSTSLGLNFDFISFPAWKIVPFYLGLILFVLFLKFRKNYYLPLFSLLIFAFIFIGTEEQSRFKLTCFDVGLGDLSLIELPDGRNIMIDSGPGEKSRGYIKSSAIPYMKEKGITHLDWVVVTHAHLDHYGGLQYLLEKNLVDTLVVTDDFQKRKIWDSFVRYNPMVKTISDTFSTNWNETSLKFLHPAKEYYSQNTNNMSIVLKVEHEGYEFLFTGDLEREGEAHLVKEMGNMLDADFLQVGHHGSRTASSTEFVQTVTPQIAVVSTALKNRFDFPHPEALDRLGYLEENLFVTGRSGAVVITLNNGELEVQTIKE